MIRFANGKTQELPGAISGYYAGLEMFSDGIVKVRLRQIQTKNNAITEDACIVNYYSAEGEMIAQDTWKPESISGMQIPDEDNLLLVKENFICREEKGEVQLYLVLK